MLELNVYSAVLMATVCFVVYLVCSRLQKPAEYRNLSSRVPSVTKSFWSEMRFSLTLATKSHKDTLPFISEVLKKNGPIVHFNVTRRDYVVLNDPNDIKVLMTSWQNITKGPEYDMFIPWLNEGLLITTGQKWHSRRKLLTNTFHVKTLDMYSPSMNRHARVMAEKLLEACAADGEGIAIVEYVTLCSLDMICETLMDIDINSQGGKSREYVDAIKRSLTERAFKFWLWNDLVFGMSASGRTFYKAINALHDFTDNVIKTKRTALNESRNQNVQPETDKRRRAKSFLDLLLDISDERPEQMTDRDIREEVDTFLFEGHDTSSISITMTLLLLGMHQDVQDRVREEVFGVFGDSDRDATAEDLHAMRYLEAVIKESLRLYPSVPALTRVLDTTLRLENYDIPPETVVAVFPYILHRNEDVYPDPEKFVPERFLDDKSNFAFAYLPFSAGPRNCIGRKYAMNQLKTIISTVLRKARIETLGTKEDIQISFQIVIRIESAPKMKFYAI